MNSYFRARPRKALAITVAEAHAILLAARIMRQVEGPMVAHDHEAVPRLDPPKPKPRAPEGGRNKPCQCGSGKKFKKCCGGN